MRVRPVRGECSKEAREKIDGVKIFFPSGMPAGGFMVGSNNTGAPGPNWALWGGFGQKVRLDFCLTYKADGPTPDNQPVEVESFGPDGSRNRATAKFLPSLAVKLSCKLAF